MKPGGASDIIERFAGYPHIPGDYARLRFDHPGSASQPHDQDWQPASSHEVGTERDIDDLPSRPFADPSAPGGGSGLIGVKLHKPGPIHSGPIAHQPVHLRLDAPEPISLVLPVFASFGAVMPPDGAAPVPGQLLASLSELNLAQNNNLVLAAGVDPTADLRDASAEASRAAIMVLRAEAAGPAWLVPGSVETASLANMVGAHDHAEASHPGGAPDAILQNGLHVDGFLQPAGTAFDTGLPVLGVVATASQLALPPGGGSATQAVVVSSPGTAPAASALSQVNGTGSLEPDSHDGLTNPGLEARTGGNVSLNTASIVDDQTPRTGLVVMGDAYSTNAIVQANVLSAHAQISLGGRTLDRSISTAGDTAHDSASVSHVDAMTGSDLSHFNLGAHVEVDDVRGNFYDIKGVMQINALSNNDTVVQTTTRSYNVVDTGTNNQVNTLPLSEFNGHYDLIVVQGSYHSANIIEQRNVLQSDSIVHEYTGRGDTALQSVTTGGNTLSNAATLDTYGNDHYGTLSPSMAGAIQDLGHGTIDASLAAQLPGSGATVHVLFVSGDFYDINVISQTNILQNNDTVLQDLPRTGAATRAASSTEQVDTGGNHLANVAGIAEIGTTSSFQYVGGHAYSDAVLVQTDIVSDTAHAAIGHHHRLAAEMQAYAGHDSGAVHNSGAVHDSGATTLLHKAPGLHEIHHPHDLLAGLMA